MSGGPVPVWKKYTTQSYGIWETIRQWLVLVPNRSSGNPTVPLYRVPARGAHLESKDYKDPVTLPASDIQKNLYFKRDSRRNYPQSISVDQGEVSKLLQFGHVGNSRLLKGEKGFKQLSVVKELTAELKTVGDEVLNGEVLGSQGEPVIAPNLGNKRRLVIVEDSGVVDKGYPCRVFNYAP